MSASIQSRVFERAAEILGGRRQLSNHLDVSATELSRWVANQETAPLPMFFAALDIVLVSEKGVAAIFPADEERRAA